METYSHICMFFILFLFLFNFKTKPKKKRVGWCKVIVISKILGLDPQDELGGWGGGGRQEEFVHE